MSKVIILPGNSVGNKSSAHDFQSLLGGEVLYYEHWENGGGMIDFVRESERLLEMAGDDAIDVVAKSAGTLLTMKAWRESRARIRRAVFLGTAVFWGEERGIPAREWLRQWHVPTLFIHNEYDPVISAATLRSMLHGQHECLILPGETHDYGEIVRFLEPLKRWLS